MGDRIIYSGGGRQQQMRGFPRRRQARGLRSGCSRTAFHLSMRFFTYSSSALAVISAGSSSRHLRGNARVRKIGSDDHPDVGAGLGKPDHQRHGLRASRAGRIGFEGRNCSGVGPQVFLEHQRFTPTFTPQMGSYSLFFGLKNDRKHSHWVNYSRSASPLQPKNTPKKSL